IPRLYVMTGGAWGRGDRPLELPPREWVERFGWFTALIGCYHTPLWEWPAFEVSEARLRQVFDWPLIDRCIGLDMAGHRHLHGECDRVLAAWPGAARLLRLGGFAGALTSPRLAGLVDVELRGADVGEGTVAALAAMPGLRRLRLLWCRFAPG